MVSLTSLHSALQSRHLATIDALSTLQSSVEPDLADLRAERDAVRAVNGVLRAKVKQLEVEVVEGRKAMLGVVEDVKNLGDFGILEHADVEVFAPIR